MDLGKRVPLLKDHVFPNGDILNAGLFYATVPRCLPSITTITYSGVALVWMKYEVIFFVRAKFRNRMEVYA